LRFRLLSTWGAAVACVCVVQGCSSGGGSSDAVGDINDDTVVKPDTDVHGGDHVTGETIDTKTTDITDSPDSAKDAADSGPSINGFTNIDLSNIGNIRDMWASHEAGIWAVGDGGLVLRFNGQGFVPVGKAPTGADLKGVSGEGSTVFVVGTGGTVLRWDEDGWSELTPPTTGDLNAVGVLDAGEFYAVGAEGLILHYLDGEWSEEGLGVTYDLYGAYASKVGGVYAVGAYGTLVELKGTVWIQSQIGGPASTMNAIWRSPDGRMYAVGTLGTVAVYDGLTWKLQVTNDTYDPPRGLYDVQGVSGDEVYAVGDKGAILKYNGKKWTLMTIAGPYNVFSDFRGVAGLVNPDGSRQMFAAGLDSDAVGLDDKTWKDQALGVNGELSGVTIREDGSVVAVGSNGMILTQEKGRFGTIEWGASTDLNAISGDYVVGDDGVLIILAGDQATKIETAVEDDLNDVWASGSNAWAVGDGGTLLEIDGEGVVELPGLPKISANAVCRPRNGVLYVTGEGGQLFLDQGSGFSNLSSGTFSTLRDIWGDPEEDRVFVVGDNGIVLSCDTFQCQRIHEDPATFLYGIGGSRSSAVLAVGWAGTVLNLVGGDQVSPLDAGTLRVFRSVAGAGPNGELYLVGADGTFVLYEP